MRARQIAGEAGWGLRQKGRLESNEQRVTLNIVVVDVVWVPIERAGSSNYRSLTVVLSVSPRRRRRGFIQMI